jgi:hypothetical protein
MIAAHAVMGPQDAREHDESVFLIVVETLVEWRAGIGDLFQRGAGLSHIVGAAREPIKGRVWLLLLFAGLARLHACSAT